VKRTQRSGAAEHRAQSTAEAKKSLCLWEERCVQILKRRCSSVWLRLGAEQLLNWATAECTDICNGRDNKESEAAGGAGEEERVVIFFVD
jgi:hypothetical protein